MKLRYQFALPVVAVCLGFAAAAHATVTIQFSQTNVGRATGFSDSAGVAGVNGMRWGIVVSTLDSILQGAGPTPTQMYDAGFSLNTAGFLSINNVLTDDYYVPAFAADTVTPLLTSNLTATGTDPGGAGGITTALNVPFGGTTNISTGDPFGVIWFQSGSAIGNAYGLLQNQIIASEFDIPADGATNSVASAFFTQVNPDPIKPANLVLSGVPEPSRFLLLGLGGIGLLLRRRRS